jgi:hypothetical protein
MGKTEPHRLAYHAGQHEEHTMKTTLLLKRLGPSAA